MSAGDALSGEQFRMHTNIKAAPGSQGTLFQGGYPTRYPRGYTPERMHEVVRATVHSGLDPSKQHASRAEMAARVRDTVARSTVPVEHLQRVGWYTNSGVSESHEALGLYTKPGEHNSRASIHIAPGAEGGLTPIHEIGHHVSHEVEKTAHSAYNTPALRGEEEGYAENYAETHFRDRRGKTQRSTSTSGGWTKKDTDEGKWQFGNAFSAKRRESPLHQDAPSQAEVNAMSPRQRGLPPQHVEGQLPLLDKTGGSGYIERYEGGVRMKKDTARHWDYTYEDQKRGLKRERE